MRPFSPLVIAVFLSGFATTCRNAPDRDKDTSPLGAVLQVAPGDPTLIPTLQEADRLIQARKYTDARRVLLHFTDSSGNDNVYQHARACNLYCYAAIRDTAFANKDTAFRVLQHPLLPGTNQDTLILAERALNLGYYYLESRPDSAHAYFNHCLELLNSYYTEDDPQMQKYYRDIGSYLLFDVQDTRSALELLAKEAELHRQWRYPSRDRFLHAYNSGVVYRALEDYDLAEHFQKRAISEIRGSGIDTMSMYLLPYASLSYLCAHRQDAERTDAYVDTALLLVNRFFSNDTANLIDYHTTLSMCYIPGNVDDPQRGLKILEKIPSYTAEMSEYIAEYADLHRAKAYLYHGLDSFGLAREEMQRAIALFESAEKLSSYHFSGYTDALLGLGILYVEDRRVTEGMPFINTAAELTFGKPLPLVARDYPARFLKYYLRWYDYLIAYGDYLLSSEDAERHLRGIPHLSARIDSAITISRDKVSDHDVLRNARLNHDIYTYMIGWCYKLQKDHFDTEVLNMAFDHIEKSRAHLLLTQISSLKLARQLGVPEAVIAQGIDITREEIATSQNLDEAGVDMLLARKQEYFQLLKSHYPEYYFKVYQPERVALSAIRNAIDDDEVLISYQLREKQLYTLVITSDTIMLASSAFDRECANSVEALYAAVSNRPGLTRNTAHLDLFYSQAQHVFNCALGNIYSIVESKRRWLISADDILEMIPFEILPEPSKPRRESFRMLPYLVNTHDIGYILSATTWYTERQRPDPELRQAAVFIHSDGSHTVRALERNQDLKYIGMPGTAKAAASICRIFGPDNVKLYRNKKATITTFLESLDNCDILHLGLHAFGDTTGRQQHGIVFPGDQSILTVADIIGMQTRASIVFLEGCETALGKQIRGEGMLNFARPFIAAGARHVLASRWRLDDQSAGQMAGLFYRELKDSNDVVYANSQVKRVFLDQATRLQSHPYYWAPVMSVQ